MSKTPLLDELRAKREIQEQEIKAPVVATLNNLNRHYNELWKEKNRIAKIASSDFGKAILNEFVNKFSMMIYRKFIKAIQNDNEIVTIKLSKSMLKSMTPETFERFCLMKYAQHMDENADLGVSENTINNKCQVLSIHIPKLDIHKIIAIDK